MKKPTTEKEWADYLVEVMHQLDTLALQTLQDAPSLQTHVEEVRKPLGHLIGYLIVG